MEHETSVVVDDRDHKSGNMYEFVAAKIEGTSPRFPLVFVLDHNGRVINKIIQGPKLPELKEIVKEQEEIYDKALKEALKSKDESDSDKKDSEDKNSSSKSDE